MLSSARQRLASRWRDFRSDTVTVPTDAMRAAMFEAPVGDDVFVEDPTVCKLESTVADMLGKRAALFCASGTMTNQLALRLHLGPLQSVLCDENSHVFKYEAGGISYHSQAQAIPLRPRNGHYLTAGEYADAIVEQDVHHAVTRVLCIENTINGRVVPLREMQQIREMADSKGIKVHLDGARLWNAASASAVPLREYTACAHSVSVCFSKGLGAPVGSALLTDSTEDIAKARHFRKLFGGGWRQAGSLAAGALHALEHHLPTLNDAHAVAAHLADTLPSVGITLPMGAPETNMLFVQLPENTNPLRLAQRLKEHHRILLWTYPNSRSFRIVTHFQTTLDDANALVDALRVELPRSTSQS